MSANVVQLERIFRRSCDWSSREMAEFYRVESALIQAGLKIETERGLSDEGDPWFSFCRPDDGEVIVHIARIGGIYILAGPSYDGIASGSDIAALVRDLVTRHPLIQMRGNSTGGSSKIFLHPAALLIAVVATAFFKSTEARALSDEHKAAGESRATALAPRSDNNIQILDSHKTIVMEAIQAAVILSAVASVLQNTSLLASTQDSNVVASISDLLEVTGLSPAAHEMAPSNSIPIAFEAHQFEMLQGFHAPPKIITGVQGVVTQQVETADALPLIAVLWNLPTAASDPKPTAHDAGDGSAVPTGISPASMPLQAPLVTFKMALSNDANESLPVVQAAKISFSGTQAAPEAQTISKADLVPTALVGVLKEAAHASIEGQPVAVSNTSFASALLQSVTDHTADTKSHVALEPAIPLPQSSPTPLPHSSSTPLPQNSSTAPPDKAISQSTPAPESPASLSPPSANKAPDVAAAVKDFFKHTPHWTMFNDDKGVVVYDTDALKGHPNELKSVTFDFSDGSTLSLVGLPAELPHFLVA